MKIRVIIAALVALATAGASHAETRQELSNAEPNPGPKTAATQSAVFIGTAVAGAVLAGPLGYLAGGLTGAWLATKVGEAEQLDESVAELAVAQQQVESMATDLNHADAETSALEHELIASRQSMDRYRHLASQYVSFELLFHTGASSLTPEGDARLNELAVFLAEQPGIDVTLSGHADARGDDEFNLGLSEQRVSAVADTLERNGVGVERLTVNAYGDQQSSANEGDLDAYALERRVTIELSAPEFATEVASTAD